MGWNAARAPGRCSAGAGSSATTPTSISCTATRHRSARGPKPSPITGGEFSAIVRHANFHGTQFHPNARRVRASNSSPTSWQWPDMQLVPAIDLRGGQCVRLLQGRSTPNRLCDDPRAILSRYRDFGARYVHVVDLDGARDGSQGNRSAIADLARAFSEVAIQVGGGVRSRAGGGGIARSGGTTRRRRQRGRDETRGGPAVAAEFGPIASYWRSTCVSTPAARLVSPRTGGNRRPRRAFGMQSKVTGRTAHCTCCARTSPGTAPSPDQSHAVRRGGATLSSDSVAGLGRRELRCRPRGARRHGCGGRDQRPSLLENRIPPAELPHSCQAHNSLPRRSRRSGREGHSLSRPQGGRRHPRAGRALLRGRRGRTGFYDITASPRTARWTAAGSRAWRGCSTFRLRGRRDPHGRRGRGRSQFRAEKISVNSPALADPGLVNALARRFGSQCVVVGIDSQTVGDDFEVYSSRGSGPLAQHAPPYARLGT